jgi:hypothetical protein
MNRKAMLWISTLCVLTALGVTYGVVAQQGENPAAQQEGVPVGLNIPSTLTADITPGTTHVEIPFDLDAADAVKLDVIIPVDNALFTLKDSAGTTVRSSGDSRVMFHAGREVNPNLPGGVFETDEITGPVSGRWVIVLDFPAAPQKTVALASIFTRTPFQAGIVLERDSFIAGEDVSVGFLIVNNGQPITGLTPIISVTPQNPPGNKTIQQAKDDGVNPDGLADDGIYSIDYTFASAGTYLIEGSVDLPNGGTTIRRTASRLVTVRSPSFSGANISATTTTGRGGCVSGINVILNVTANAAGDFVFGAILKASNGNVLSARDLKTVIAGNNVITLSFSTDDLRSVLGVNGPYLVSAVDIFRFDSVNGFELAYKARDVVNTPSVSLSALCVAPVQLEESLQTAFTLQNGFISALDLKFPITVDNAGSYSISFKIIDSLGNDVGLYAGNRSLRLGRNDVTFTIPARDFLKGDGPYSVISLLVLGSSGSSSLSNLGTTGDLKRWQFLPLLRGDLNNDGFVDALDRPFIAEALDQAALVPGDRRDLNRDGVINNLDLDLLTTLCTRQPCVPVCAEDMTTQITITRGGLRLNLATDRFVQSVAIQNTGSNTIQGPLSLVLDGLSSNATLFSAIGRTTCAAPRGSSFVNIGMGGDGVLSPGETSTITLEFVNPTRSGITYNTRVLGGNGDR